MIETPFANSTRSLLVALATMIVVSLFAPRNGNAVDLLALQEKIQTVSSQVSESVVSINSTPRDSWGSGVIVSEAGHLYTAAHVVDAVGETVTVFLANGQAVKATVLSMNTEIDAAVLQFVSFRPTAAQIAAIAEGAADRGDACVAIGHALGYEAGRKAPVRFGTFSHSSKNGNLLTSCRMAAGDSGGPLFNLEGELLAIHRTVDAAGEFTSHIDINEFNVNFASIVSPEGKMLVIR